jgi:predicted transcriptional regulator
MGAALDEVEYLVRSDHRVGVFESLAERPRDRADLRAATGASSPTMGRILSDFEERHWVEREGHSYRLTGLGEFVADRLVEFLGAMTIEQRLRAISPWLPYELDGFGVELLADAVVSYPGPGYPYEPLDRNDQLIAETETIRGFGMVLVKASVLEEFFDHVFDGLVVEMIYPPRVLRALLEWDEDVLRQAVALETHSVYVHDDLPNSEWCGICLSDDRLSICCYEPETGMLRSLVDTGAPEAYAWGESIVDRYRAEAEPLESVDDLVSI